MVIEKTMTEIFDSVRKEKSREYNFLQRQVMKAAGVITENEIAWINQNAKIYEQIMKENPTWLNEYLTSPDEIVRKVVTELKQRQAH